MTARQSLAEPVPGRVRALCCECGAARTYRAGWHPRNRVPEGRADQHPAPYWRVLGDMRCEGACDGVTRHALLRDHDPDDWRNYAERVNAGLAGAYPYEGG